jgi:hypothetical protein
MTSDEKLAVWLAALPALGITLWLAQSADKHLAYLEVFHGIVWLCVIGGSLTAGLSLVFFWSRKKSVLVICCLAIDWFWLLFNSFAFLFSLSFHGPGKY